VIAVHIDELIARCPRFSKVVFHVSLESATVFTWASPGDALQLFEHVNGVATGRRLTALVIAAGEPALSFIRALRPPE
jgi:hypothetical protein